MPLYRALRILNSDKFVPMSVNRQKLHFSSVPRLHLPVPWQIQDGYKEMFTTTDILQIAAGILRVLFLVNLFLGVQLFGPIRKGKIFE